MTEQQTYLTPDINPRLAAVDVGSNSIRLVVAEAQAGGRYRVLDEERETTRLGKTLATTGVIDDAAIEATLAALRRFKSIAAGLGVENVRAIATCAVREAANGDEICRRVRDEVGLEIEVIDSAEEARLAFESVRRRFDLAGKNTLLADIGGGSTEIVLATGDIVEAVYGTRLGAVRIAEKFGPGGGVIDDAGIRRMMRWIDDELRRTTEKPPAAVHQLIGSGGTFTNLASMIMASRGLARLPASGCRCSRADVRHLVDRLRKMSSVRRRETPGLNPDRVDIIVPGLAVVDAIMRRFKVNVLQVHNYGVRDGLLFTMLDELQGASGGVGPSVDEQIDRFSEACGVDVKHSRHIGRLATQIYAGLAPRFDLPENDMPLLDAAARMQDVGYLISYEGHHKHAYHLILHSDLEAFRPEEIEIIANVARYHRGSTPKKKHENFQGLSPVDKERVRRMAAILRVAGGLDRSHNQIITGVEVDAPTGGGPIEIRVHAADFPEVDLWAARKRTELFERAFGAEVSLQWAEHAAMNGAAATHQLQPMAAE